MDYAYRMFQNVKFYYEQINPASLSGAIDVIVVEQPNGDLLSTPFHVRFGKYGVFNYKEKFVDILINGQEVQHLRMKLGENGIAFFVEETAEAVPDYLVTSPVPGDLRPTTDKVLAETSRTLERHLKEGGGKDSSASAPSSSFRPSHQRTPSKPVPLVSSSSTASSTLSPSMTPPPSAEPIVGSAEMAMSPGGALRRSKSMVRGREAERMKEKEAAEGGRTHDDQSALAQQRKMTLPYSSSVFSARKLRSLPNLTSVGVEGSDEESKGTTTTTAAGAGAVSHASSTATSTHKTPVRRAPRPRHTKSSALERGAGSSLNRPSTLSESSPTVSRRDSPATPHTTPTKSPKGVDSVDGWLSKGSASPGRTAPIAIQISQDDECSSSSSSTVSSPAASMMDSVEISRLADSALSDSEVDRAKRDSPEANGKEVAEWAWGEFPKTRDDQKKEAAEAEKEKPKAGWWGRPWGTSWWGSTAAPTKGGKEGERGPFPPGEGAKQGGGGAQTAEESALFEFLFHTNIGQQDGGIYLDDLMSDPGNIERYLGTKTRHPTTGARSVDGADSGNGSQMPTSPSSPASVGSGQEGALEDRTPTEESVSAALSRVEGEGRRDGATPPPTPVPATATVKEEEGGTPQRSEEIFPMSEDEDVTQEEEVDGAEGSGRATPTEIRFIRSLRLSSSRLRSLGLQYGANECRFSITTKFQGTSWCACNIYLYKASERIVISDIDGTITRSDVLGHIIPAIGGQWAHAGVAELYTRIKHNGYKLVYLSSRAIGQSSMTKNYLKKVQQDSRVLPDGPVLLAPDSVLVAFRREVIERRPEEFKIAALGDLKKLFPAKHPFFAGFGNRETDVKSYRAVGVDSSRILIIDPSGTVKRADSDGYKSSYKCMAQDSVDCIFPPILDERARKKPHLTRLSFTRPQTTSSYTFWSTGSGNVSDDELAAYEKKRQKKK